jgi:hypothetical protein
VTALICGAAYPHYSFHPNHFLLMAKAQDARKEKKKEPTKSLKEKKAEKDEKKAARARKQD